MHLLTHGQQAVELCDDLERAIPDFDSKEAREYFSHVQVAHRHMMAAQALITELRVQLKLSGRYMDSKLAMMTKFRVKQSELSGSPLRLGVWSSHKMPLKRLKAPPPDAGIVVVKEAKKRGRPKSNSDADDEDFNENGSD